MCRELLTIGRSWSFRLSRTAQLVRTHVKREITSHKHGNRQSFPTPLTLKKARSNLWVEWSSLTRQSGACVSTAFPVFVPERGGNPKRLKQRTQHALAAGLPMVVGAGGACAISQDTIAGSDDDSSITGNITVKVEPFSVVAAAAILPPRNAPGVAPG
jgi:hypothetical protein